MIRKQQGEKNQTQVSRSPGKRRRWIRRLLLPFLVAAAIVLIGTGILVITGLRDVPGTADVALVLGSKVELDGKPSRRLQARLDKTVELYRKGSFPEIIVSGGFGKEGYDESVVMRDYLVDHGIPTGKIILDGDGVTTYASAQNARKIADQHHFQSVYVVTQYFHIPRSRLVLGRFGFKEVYSSHAELFEARDVYSSLREFFGYLSYRLRKIEP